MRGGIQEKSDDSRFRSCIFSEIRSRFDAKRYTFWPSQFQKEQSRSFYFTFHGTASQGDKLQFDTFCFLAHD
jgi:hypothetical protein